MAQEADSRQAAEQERMKAHARRAAATFGSPKDRPRQLMHAADWK
jgi:hypothetical protein